MRKVIKWSGIGLIGLLGVIVLAVLGLSFNTNRRLNQIYTIQPEPLSIPSDARSIEEGQRLASIYCASCHGADMGGTEVFNDPAVGVVGANNLTSGQGGIGASYQDVDWVRAIRHGVGPDGKPLFIMPSKDFYYLSDESLGQLIAYLKSLQPVNSEVSEFSNTLFGRVLIAVGAFGDVLNAETIDHQAARPTAPTPAISVAYGDYLVKTFGCRTCHGEALSGGKDPNPDAPPGPNLTPGGAMASWSEEDFIAIVRNRRSEWMPFESLSKMTDDELKAIFLYLQSLPAMETTMK